MVPRNDARDGFHFVHVVISMSGHHDRNNRRSVMLQNGPICRLEWILSTTNHPTSLTGFFFPVKGGLLAVAYRGHHFTGGAGHPHCSLLYSRQLMGPWRAVLRCLCRQSHSGQRLIVATVRRRSASSPYLHNLAPTARSRVHRRGQHVLILIFSRGRLPGCAGCGATIHAQGPIPPTEK